MEIAIYGKGGIGKSTVSANLSAALACLGHSVLQIGCDPKHDSTRLLLGGATVPTVLDYLRDTPKEMAEVGAILHEGLYGVGCIEAGGPKPGVGCAGRGIISAFEFLERNKVKEQYDLVLYDVLGDVVCGGFAVPIRREYADAVILVTSGEFMSIYAANNILRGIRNFDGSSHHRVAGILFNERGLMDEAERVERFAHAVSLPIIARIPRSEAFAEAERRKMPVVALGAFPNERKCFFNLAEQVAAGMPLYEAIPVEDEALERIVLGAGSERAGRSGLAETIPLTESGSLSRAGYETDPELNNGSDRKIEPEAGSASAPEGSSGPQNPSPRASRPPLYGCAFTGAAVTAIKLTDAVVIAHSPRSCAFFTWQTITSSGRKNIFNKGIVIPSAVKPYLECTEITHSESVFGGTDKLVAHVRKAMERKPGAVIVITSCVSGIIGDDMEAVRALETPETPVIVIKADGDIGGDYMEGIRMCHRAVAEKLIDRTVPKEENSVNLIGEISVSNNLEEDFRTFESMLAPMGIRVNCRFLGGATTEEVRHFLAAPLNILAGTSSDNLALKEYFQTEYGCVFSEHVLPTGSRSTAAFLRRIGRFFGKKEEAEQVIQSSMASLEQKIDALKPVLSGRRVLMTTIAVDMDWVFRAAREAGMQFVYVGVADYLHQGIPVSTLPEILRVTEECYDLARAEEKIRELHPDLVVSNYTAAFTGGDYVLDTMPMTIPAGFYSEITVLERWARAFERAEEGEWSHDRALYEKYFA